MTDFNWMLWIVTPIIIVYYLYRHVWPAVRKFIRLFQGITDAPPIGKNGGKLILDVQCQGVKIGSLLQGIKWTYGQFLVLRFRQVRTGIDAYALKKAKDRIFQQHMDSQEDYDKAVEQLHNLEDCYDELLECGTITCREDLLRYGVTGWDAGRLNFMARACYDMKYISEDEAWHYINHAYEMVHSRFSSWHDFAMSYVIGRALW